MKTALGIILALFGLAADVFAANPSFQSFDTNDFIITPSLSNPRMIHARRSGVTNSWTNSVITYSNTVILIDGVNLTNFISGTAFMTNYTLVAGTNIVISTNVVGTNVTWTINATGGSSGTFTNYFLEAGTNIVVSTNTSGTNVTWTVNGVGDGVGALTNYFLEAGANVTLTTNVVGTNVTWTVSAGGGTNYFLEAGTNIVLTTNVVGTNVTWTVNSSGGGDDHLVFASGFDTTPGVLIDKMLAGVGITLGAEGDTDDHVHVSLESSMILWTNNNSVVELTDSTLPIYIARNIGARLTVGDTAVVNANFASQTNQVSGAMTFTHATNGVDQIEVTHVRWLPNGSGSDQTLTIPSGWRTNVFSPVPTKLTNATITAMYVKFLGPTDTAARQTNCYVSFEFYK